MDGGPMTSDYEISLDRVIYQQSRGLFVKVQEPINPGSSNFLIVSHYGGYDWSGFRRLDEINSRTSKDKETTDSTASSKGTKMSELLNELQHKAEQAMLALNKINSECYAKKSVLEAEMSKKKSRSEERRV